ncbi:uncharacterized protein LOC131688977 [Topomyia yanbarensis]|uniref:uncharacterized protein LOC131688977 n=1 Tax=Topomyia yanbarensis TaxID=2498891 RepID=UPI00273BDB8C|nr:uncharacterized protein LOC131688977 [Topomyia yanbarensis]
MSQPQMAADWHADYSDNLVLHDISVESTTTSGDGDGINDNGVSSSYADDDDLGGDVTASLSHVYSSAAHGVGPIVSDVLFVSTTATTSPSTYSSSTLSQSQSLPLSSASGTLESNEQPAYGDDDNHDTVVDEDNGDDDDGEYELNFQSTASTSSSDYDSQPDEQEDADEIFTANDNDITYVTTNNDPDLITNNSFDVESSTVVSVVSSADDIQLDYVAKLGYIEEEKLPNDDPLALYEHLNGAEMDDVVDVELISLEDGPISGEEMRKTRNKLYYKNVQEKQGQESERVEIHTLPSPVENRSQIVPVPISPPQVPIYLVHEAVGSNDEQKEGPVLPRLLVNISIATDNGTGTVQHSVYVLQVSIPTPSEYIPRPNPSEFDRETVDSNHSCPPEPPPAPPCPIKCPNSSLFEKYQVINVIDESGSFEEVEDSSEAPDFKTNEIKSTVSRSEEQSTETTITEQDTDGTMPPVWECPKITPPPILILEGELMQI